MHIRALLSGDDYSKGFSDPDLSPEFVRDTLPWSSWTYGVIATSSLGADKCIEYKIEICGTILAQVGGEPELRVRRINFEAIIILIQELSVYRFART